MSSLVTKEAPNFTAQAVMADNSFQELTLADYRGKYVALFFYPLDFTFVCPSEILAFNQKVSEFKERGCELVGISIDSHFTHNAWRNTAINDGGIGPVKYTLAADMAHDICRAYDVELADGSVAYRGAFIIDRDGMVRSQIVNDLPLGRNMDELLRLVDALQFHEEHGEVCPAGWNKGDSGMKDSPDGVASYLSENADKL